MFDLTFRLHIHYHDLSFGIPKGRVHRINLSISENISGEHIIIVFSKHIAQVKIAQIGVCFLQYISCAISKKRICEKQRNRGFAFCSKCPALFLQLHYFSPSYAILCSKTRMCSKTGMSSKTGMWSRKGLCFSMPILLQVLYFSNPNALASPMFQQVLPVLEDMPFSLLGRGLRYQPSI